MKSNCIYELIEDIICMHISITEKLVIYKTILYTVNINEFNLHLYMLSRL
jgi:hypothetical protein